MNHFIRDLQTITRQLGRSPRGLRRVARRCHKTFPLVIITHPLVGKEPFPTLYYLTCPLLVKEVSQLEEAGLIRELQDFLATDLKLQKDFFLAQRGYREERFALLSPAEKKRLSPDKGHVLRGNGIAGVRDLFQIKCLHAHYAHFLATGTNPIGKIIHQRVKEISLRDDRSKRAEKSHRHLRRALFAFPQSRSDVRTLIRDCSLAKFCSYLIYQAKA